MSLFQSKLRKQIRNLPKILKSVKIIHYFSLLFIRVLRREPPGPRAELLGRRRGARRRRRAPGPLRGAGGDASARPAHRAHEGPLSHHVQKIETPIRWKISRQRFPKRSSNFSGLIIVFLSVVLLAQEYDGSHVAESPSDSAPPRVVVRPEPAVRAAGSGSGPRLS